MLFILFSAAMVSIHVRDKCKALKSSICVPLELVGAGMRVIIQILGMTVLVFRVPFLVSML